ncbi:MAG: RIP metalloprotease RseP [Gemmatimonadales bacterium]|nr:MAG: RIP metalloprotease RseP [Gemmatimonadales bacterium]
MIALQTTLSLLVVLGILVFVHEAGHFLAAKWAGVWVHRFALGIGTPIPGLSFKWRETEYAICWLPLGGYVKMATAEEEATSSALEGGTPDVIVPPDMYFEAKPVWKRMIIILAGVTMNALFAWAVFSGLAIQNGRAFDPETRVGQVDTTAFVPALAPLAQLAPGDSILAVNGTPVHNWGEVIDGIMNGPADTITIAVAGKPEILLAVHPDAVEERATAAQSIASWRPPLIGTVTPGGPASQAGFRPGDLILTVDGIAVPQWWDLTALIEARNGDSVAVQVARGDDQVVLTVVPASRVVSDADGSERTVGMIGVGSRGQVVYEPLTFLEAIGEGFDATLNASTTVVRSVRGMLTGRVSGRNIGGPIAIGQMAAASAEAGLGVFFGFLGIISINLAVLNLLPIPILDGGQFLFLLAEGILRRPLSLKLRERLTVVGLVLVMALMLFAFWNDLSRIFLNLG